MSEVSSWSPTDASNNLTPPNGWPEGMQPSGVNDVGRMMMGAIKRWYDTVTAGIANCLPLSGGALTGPLQATYLHSTGAIAANGDVTGHSAFFSADINASNAVGANYIHSTGNIAADGSLTGASVFSSGSIAASGNITGAGITASGDINAGNAIGAHYIHSTGDVAADGSLTGASVFSSGNITGNYILSNTNIDAIGTVAGATVVAHNQLTSENTATVTNALTAGSLWSNSTLSAISSVSAASANIANSIACNSLTASALVNTVTYQLSGNAFVTRRTDGAGTCNAIYDGGGGVGIDLYGVNGSYYRCNNAHFFTNRAATLNICRFQATDGNCINASGLWNSVSDASTKEADSIEPYRAGLAAALRLSTVSFRYAPGANPFAIDGQTYYGLVAQDVEQVVPEMVGRTDEGLATVAPGHLVFVLLNAVKELEARLAQVENRGE